MTKSKEKEITKLYQKALNEYIKLLKGLYAQYSIEGKLIRDELNKYGRLDTFHKNVITIMKRLYKEYLKLMLAHIKQVYSESYYYHAWSIETDSLVKLGYKILGKEEITKAVQDNPSAYSLTEIVKKQLNATVNRLKEMLALGIATESTYTALSKSVKREMDKSVNKAVTTVRQESGRVIEDAKLKSAIHATNKGVVMEKSWNNLGDERVRLNHRRLQDKTIPVEGFFVLENDRALAPRMFSKPENSINCRCILIYQIKEIISELKQHEELADMNLDTWKKERLS